VTETRATPVFPPGRYGRRRAGDRRFPLVPALLAVVGVLVGLLLAVRLYRVYGSQPYRGEIISIPETADDHVTLRIQAYKPAGRPAVCHVRALARDGSEAGTADVDIPAASVTVTYRLATNRRPVTAEVTSCAGRPAG
jgi:hypothetical protein